MTKDSERARLYRVGRALKLYKHALQPIMEPELWATTPIKDIILIMRQRAQRARRVERMPRSER